MSHSGTVTRSYPTPEIQGELFGNLKTDDTGNNNTDQDTQVHPHPHGEGELHQSKIVFGSI